MSFENRMDQTLISTPDVVAVVVVVGYYILIGILDHIGVCQDTPCMAAVVAAAAAARFRRIHRLAGQPAVDQTHLRAGRVFLCPVVEAAEKRTLNRRYSEAGDLVWFHQ